MSGQPTFGYVMKLKKNSQPALRAEAKTGPPKLATPNLSLIDFDVQPVRLLSRAEKDHLAEQLRLSRELTFLIEKTDTAPFYKFAIRKRMDGEAYNPQMAEFSAKCTSMFRVDKAVTEEEARNIERRYDKLVDEHVKASIVKHLQRELIG